MGLSVGPVEGILDLKLHCLVCKYVVIVRKGWCNKFRPFSGLLFKSRSTLLKVYPINRKFPDIVKENVISALTHKTVLLSLLLNVCYCQLIIFIVNPRDHRVCWGFGTAILLFYTYISCRNVYNQLWYILSKSSSRSLLVNAAKQKYKDSITPVLN
jgi:hypothetical protein